MFRVFDGGSPLGLRFRWVGRIGGMAVLSLLAVGLAQGRTDDKHKDKPAYDLSPTRQIGERQKVEAKLDVAGTLRLKRNEKIEQLPLSVQGAFTYDEQLLAIDEIDRRPQPRGLRIYREASARIDVQGGGGGKPELRPERRTVVADLAAGGTSLFSPAGALTRDEYDLLQGVGNSLVLNWLLPPTPVSIGQTWEHPGEVLAALLGLDLVAQSQVQSELAEIQDDTAVITLAGTLSGATEGIETEMELKAKYAFNLTRRRITGLTLAIKEQRSIGHASPGLDITAKLRMRLTPIEESSELDAALQSPEALVTTPTRRRLLHQPVAGGFEFSCDPRWFIVSDDTGLAVLRLVDRGDLVAQCNISLVPARSADRPLALNQYQREVEHALGKDLERIITASEWSDSQGQLVYRIVAQGEVQGLPIEWHYYLVAHPGGRRVALAFTVEAGLVERMGDADRELVATLVLSDNRAGGSSAGRPAPARKR